jgi:hypothetical protein
MLSVLVIAVALVLVHEAGHVLANRQLGGRFQGAVFLGIAVGVRLELPAGRRAVVLTSLAGPAMEGALSLLLILVMSLHWLTPALIPWTLGVLGFDWLLNLTPLGATDGARLLDAWRSYRSGRPLPSLRASSE